MLPFDAYPSCTTSEQNWAIESQNVAPVDATVRYYLYYKGLRISSIFC